MLGWLIHVHDRSTDLQILRSVDLGSRSKKSTKTKKKVGLLTERSGPLSGMTQVNPPPRRGDRNKTEASTRDTIVGKTRVVRNIG
jgi:hypothetical protein